MKKNLRSFLFISCLVICWYPSFSQQRIAKPKYVSDSITIISPDIEIYHRTAMAASEPDLQMREKVYGVVVAQTKLLLTKSEFVDLDIMHQSYRNVNHLIETKFGTMMRSKEQLEVPEELIVKKSKYTFLLSAGGSYGYSSRSYFRISVINNETKKFEYYNDVFIENVSIGNLSNVKRQITHLIKEIIKN